MLLNLISLYIAGILSVDLDSNFNVLEITSKDNIVKLASNNFGYLIDNHKVPVKDPHFISPIIDAKSAISIDLKSGQPLFEKNIHVRRPIASITKLMTIIITMEENSFDEVVTISRNAANTEGSTMFLREGEQITVENLIYGALIHSANDAAVALAEHNSENVKDFVEKMNAKALELGLVNTHFANPTGLDQHKNYSSVYDLARLGKYIYQYDFIAQAAQIPEKEVASVDGKYIHKLSSTNILLDSFIKFKGLKTGQTDSAGQCLVGIAENSEGNEILTVLLNSDARFKETKILAEWIFRAYKW